MGYFVEVGISEEKCIGLSACGACVKVCPVSIFEKQGDRPQVADKNVDECILCDQCLERCEPDAISIDKKY
ncbi:4Fe-4S dicluster domain-containing protein [Desulfoferula mesophila]|uniref:4Fe-4S ferredoxin-type domain-containing protein n=1 Tax=Desulfoferula mesophila TaxID=3058419 RepID=A0AAU9ED58_9BACT|nr:hypothetical protein FAK_18260 [Desulfoferula mesophilus]